MGLFKGCFEGKRVLITGAAGVKGSWLTLLLNEAGATTIGLDVRDPTADSAFTTMGLGEHTTLVRGDVTDLPLVQSLVRQADTVFHLAAQALVGLANRYPMETYRSNTLGTITLLEALRLASKPVDLVVVSTDKVYKPRNDNDHDEPWTEADPLFASGSYAVSKACAEQVCWDYHHRYLAPTGVRSAVARAGNVIIGGDTYTSRSTGGAGRLFVDCYDALIHGRTPKIHNPGQVRPYTYGLDVLCGYSCLAASLSRPSVVGKAFNFGPPDYRGTDNATLATGICRSWGNNQGWAPGEPRDEPHVFQRLSLDRAQKLLAWRPIYSIDRAIDDTTLWYREWSRKRAFSEAAFMETTAHEILARFLQHARQSKTWWAE